MDIKVEIKEEYNEEEEVSCFPDFCLQNDREVFSENSAKMVKNEISNIDSELDNKIEIEQVFVTDFHSQYENGFFSEDPLINVSKHNVVSEVDTKVEIKEEQDLLERSSTEDNEIKDDTDAFCSAESSRLYTEVPKDESLLLYDEDLEEDISFDKRKHISECKAARKCKTQESDEAEISPPEEKTFKAVLVKNSLSYEHKCNICEKRFPRSSHLRKHRVIHEDKKPHKCDTCNKGFNHLSSLKIHKLNHEGKKPYKCDTCGKGFTQLSDLKRHSLIHGNKKPHKCDICEKEFTHSTGLKTHKLIHEGKPPYKCDTCEMGFTHLSSLKVHTLNHEGIKPYKCDTCGKGFTQLSDLKRHKLIHDGKKPHKCIICEKSFTNFSNLKRHKLIHEGKYEINEKRFN